MTDDETNAKPANAEHQSGKGLDEMTCSLLAWKPYQGAVLGYSPKMPDVTLFVIELLPLDETRGTLSGAFVPDAVESRYACKRAPIAFLKGMAERLFFEFMEIHTANDNNPATGSTPDDHAKS